MQQTGKEVLFLSGNDIKNALSMKEAIEAVKSAFVQLSSGKAQVPLRSRIDVTEEDCALFMPVYLPEQERIGLKSVTVYPENKKQGRPAIQAMVMVFNAHDGSPEAILDGELLTAMRTGAASGLATDLLAKKEANTLALFGAGVQGRWQFLAVNAVRPLKAVFVVDRDDRRAENLVKEIQQLFPNMRVETASPRQAVAAADIICTATTSLQPVFEDDWIKPGTHINGIGSFKPDIQEIPQETVQRARVFVDSRQACLQEAGDLLIPLKKGLISEAHVLGEIGQVAAGELKGRTDERQITFFKSVGNGVQDLATAAVAISKAKAMGLGQTIYL